MTKQMYEALRKEVHWEHNHPAGAILHAVGFDDRSTTFRSLQKLVTLGLCVKETKTIKEGGYYHVYSAVDMATFKVETEKRVKDLQKSLDRLLKKFEDDMHKAISSIYEKK